MNDYLFSFMLYAVPANLITVPIMVFGRKRVRWHVLEYPFIYLPWLAFIALMMVIFGRFGQVQTSTGVRAFLLILQSIGSGIMGGVILLPRLFIKQQKLSPVLVTIISAFTVALLYVWFRALLFIMVAGMSQVSPW